jgi:hypothetical protein
MNLIHFTYSPAKNKNRFFSLCYAAATFHTYNGLNAIKELTMNMFYYRLPTLGLAWGTLPPVRAQRSRVANYCTVSL